MSELIAPCLVHIVIAFLAGAAVVAAIVVPLWRKQWRKMGREMDEILRRHSL